MSTISAFTVTALLALGTGDSSTPCHSQPRAIQPTRPAVPAHAVPAPVPPRASATTWLDYFDLRSEPGDELTAVARRALEAALGGSPASRPDT